MPSLDITDDQHDRITALREDLENAHAGSYTSVTLPDVMAYLLDLADAVDDPERCAEIESGAEATDRGPFPRAALEATLSERNRRHTDETANAAMDLYSIAAEYDVAGRSNMTKQELITAILDAVERRYTDPLAPVDLDVPRDVGGASEDESASGESASGELASGELASEESASETADGATETTIPETSDEAGDDGQLNAMLSLLETHQDKWREGDGDARYEVDLPDGRVEQARTKDDVRAILFKHY